MIDGNLVGCQTVISGLLVIPGQAGMTNPSSSSL